MGRARLESRAPAWLIDLAFLLAAPAFTVEAHRKLTPSERRVAQMAAEGMINREIAQSLFVTEKTVEAHLSHTYAKRNVRSRTELPGALTASVTA